MIFLIIIHILPEWLFVLLASIIGGFLAILGGGLILLAIWRLWERGFWQ
jgi:hypothetical protein